MSSKCKDRDRDRERVKERSKSRDKDRERRRRDKSRDREKRSRERVRDKSRSRDKDHNISRQRSKSRNRKSRSKSRDKDRERRRRDKSRDREKRSRERVRDKSRSRNKDHNISRQRSKSRNRKSRSRNRSRSHERRSRERDRRRERERERYRNRESSRDIIKENKIDLTQAIMEVVNKTSFVPKNIAALFNCSNSNDSLSNGASEVDYDGTGLKKKKKSRWGGSENDKTFIPGMPTILPSTLDPTQQEAYLVQLQIEEISRKLRTGDLGIPQNPEERSPSPEPIYSSDGKRLNTREFRTRKRLEEQRHQLVMRMQCMNPEFKPPADYKPPVIRVSDKVLIPQEEHPDINFVGLLIGPRGNTLKAMEKETGAKIIIRGKGSVKEGKVGRKDGQPLPGEDEPLHAFITAGNPECVKKAVDKIKEVIRQGIEVPEGHNDLRRMQLRELAQLNGTLRETDCPRCTNCGSTEHKSWLCPDKPNVTNNIVCTSCGGAGHIAKDCRTKRPGQVGPISADSQTKIDEEYLSLMAELGEGPPPTKQIDPLVQAHLNRGYSLFDQTPKTAPKAITAPTPVQSVPNPNTLIPPAIPPPQWNGNSLIPPMPPVMPPTQQLPSTATTPQPVMPWMQQTLQPPPPGTIMAPPPSPLAPPGTGPSVLPPPPGTTNAPLPPWGMNQFQWNSNTPAGFGPPVPPPPPTVPLPILPPNPISNLIKPPPPPPG